MSGFLDLIRGFLEIRKPGKAVSSCAEFGALLRQTQSKDLRFVPAGKTSAAEADFQLLADLL